ncbi:hypothetical protein BDZ89DRAFT_164983 [Hymenopellis radicata]|nr:hypothetical protein BDZ89DRAFT_164983 [Hymenopellis radicata]
MRHSSNGSGSSRGGRLSLILHLSSRKSSRGATKDAGSQSPPCSPISSIYPFYSSPNHSAGGYSTTSLRSALLPPSIYMNPEELQSTDAVPPTKNDLDAKEKAMLLKKARKLSKVFGEIPVLRSVPDVPPSPAPPAVRHKRSLSLASMSSASSGTRTARRRPSQPDFTQSDLPSLPLPQITEARLSLIAATENESQSSLSTLHAATPSTSSLTSSSGHTTEQAKPSITLAAHHSTPSLPSPTRRQSIDSSPAADSQDDALPKPNQVKRSRSMFAHRKRPGTRPPASQESIDFRTRYNDNFGADSDDAMSLRQKVA